MPRKNVLPLCGKPLIGWTLDAASAARSVGRVIVSTDDAEIAAVARHFRAEVVWRPPEISGDLASSEEALLHALEHLEKSEAHRPELLVFLQCTSPLTLPEDIDGTVEALLRQQADTALAVTPFHYFLWAESSSEGAVGVNHDKRVRLLRQQRSPQYRETGAVYAMRAQAFRQARHRFFGKTAMHVIPAERCLEIDEPVDFQVAEMLLRDRTARRHAEALPERVSALVLDFDGVFTDNRVMVFGDGREAVLCHRGDGWGLEALRKRGLPMLVISTEANPVVAARCEKLQLEYRQAVGDKLAVLQQWLTARNISCRETLYLGNDVNDLPCLRAVGCPIAVADAHPEAKQSAKIVLNSPGGQGAIRELAELILMKQETKPPCATP